MTNTNTTFHVDLEPLVYWIKKVQAELPHVLKEAVESGGFLLEGGIKENIIVYDFIDTGATLNSVGTRDVDSEPDSMAVEVGPTTEYAIFGELGLGGQTAKPFIGDTVAQRGKAIEKVMFDKVMAGIDKLVADAHSGDPE